MGWVGEDDFGVVSKAELLVRGSGTMKRSLKEKFGQRWMRRIPAIFELFYYDSKFSRQWRVFFFYGRRSWRFVWVFGYGGCRSRFDSVYVWIRTYELRGWFFVAKRRSSFSETAESITSINEVVVGVIKERTSLSFFFFFFFVRTIFWGILSCWMM